MKVDDVARCARVSPSTVSRVLNNAASVRSATRARVVKAMEALRYGPNLHARSLATGKSRSIGIIVSNIENPFSWISTKRSNAEYTAPGMNSSWPAPMTVQRAWSATSA